MPTSMNGKLASLIVALVVFVGMLVPVMAQGPDPIKDVQIVQVLGKQLDGRSDYVAGKDTVIRVFLATPVTGLDPATQKVAIKRDGTAVTTLDPSAGISTNDVLTFTCNDRATCGNWAAGKYTFEVTIGTATQIVDGIIFQERRGLKVLAVPMKNNYKGQVQTPQSLWKKSDALMKTTFPIAPANFKWQLGQEIDLSDPKYDLTTPEGKFEVWQAAANLQPKQCAGDPKNTTCYDIIIGVMADPIRSDKGMTLGYTYGAPVAIVSESDPTLLATVPHEVAHVYNIGDEYDQMGGAFRCKINPPPANYVGRNFDLPKDDANYASSGYSCADSKETAYPSTVGGTGDLIDAAKYFPFDVGGRGALPDMVSWMGSGDPTEVNWVTPKIYASLFDSFAPAAKTGKASSGLTRLLTPVRYIYALGTLPKDAAKGKIRVEPWWSYMDDAPFVPAATGLYSIEAQDASGKALASQKFNVSFVAQTNPPTDLADAPFEVGLPFPEGTTKFVIKKGTAVVYELKVSANTPEVKITAPSTSAPITGTYAIKWTGTDKDNDPLTYDVEYSQDGTEENFFPLATGITTTQWTDDFSTLPGGDKAVIRVWATDGLNAAYVESAPFQVPARAPEVWIDDPADNATVKTGNEIALTGGGYDYQDGDLYADASLVWKSDMQGDLGKGELIYVTLKPGTHKITLTGTNSFKLAGTATITVTVK